MSEKKGLVFGHIYTKYNRVCRIAAIAGTPIPVPCHVVKSLQLIWRSSTSRWNLLVPNLQKNCSDLKGHQDSSTHYSDIIMSAMASKITNIKIVYSTIYSGANQRKHQSSTSLAFVRGIHQWPVNSLHKGPVTRIMFPFDDVIMSNNCQDDIPY